MADPIAALRPYLYRGFSRPAPLCILRVHKTGSKSFRKAFLCCYLAGEVGPLGTAPGVSPAALQGRRFAAPHLSLADWQALGRGTAPWTIAVTLREPRARLRSAFRYFSGFRPGHPTGSGELLRGLDYAGFLASAAPEIAAMRDNVIARFLGGGRFGPGDAGRNKLYLPDGIGTAEAGRRAVAAIQGGAVLPLLLEAPERSMDAVARRIGLRRRPAMAWKNRTGTRAGAGACVGAAGDLEEAAIRADQAVYAAAFERLEAAA